MAGDPDDLPSYSSDLGRAIVRGQKDRAAQDRLVRRGEPPAGAGVALRRFTISPARGVPLRYFVGACLVFTAATLLSMMTPVPFLPALVFGLLGLAAIAWSYPPTTLVVGADGVVVRGRFIPYACICGVHHERALGFHAVGGSEYDDAMEERYTWRAYLSLDDRSIDLTTRITRAEADPQGAELVSAIEAARAVWLAGRDVDAGAVARGERSGAEWLDALRKLGARKADYRVPALEIERFAQLLEDRRAKPSARAAAAVVLRAAGDEAAAKKLRIAAQALIDGRMRIAMERVSDAAEDAAVAEALAALDEADREEGAL